MPLIPIHPGEHLAEELSLRILNMSYKMPRCKHVTYRNVKRAKRAKPAIGFCAATDHVLRFLCIA